MSRNISSIGTLGTVLVIAAFSIGTLSAWFWVRSDADWSEHLMRSDFSGQSLYATLMTGVATPNGVDIYAVPEDQQALANRGAFTQLDGIPRPSRVTNLSILDAPGPRASGNRLELAVIAAELQYPLADISEDPDHSPEEILGALTRVIASYCSAPVIFARKNSADWVRVDGSDIWGCDAAPVDRRLPAVLAAIVGIGIIVTVLLDTTGKFGQFAELLRKRAHLGGPDRYETEGPDELRDIVDAVNWHLQAERDQLEKRAMVLSGVSHDLGTPATRLRLRAELIDDTELRRKLEADIDQLTGIIESVLTFTRTEIGSEEPRQLSLTSLVEALVSDYSDTGRPVDFSDFEEETVLGGRSVFMSKQGHGVLPDEHRIIVTARPVSLQRALANLIDNALKYGRRATVRLEADADTATIIVEDEGSEYSPEELDELVAPYRRGKNSQTLSGFGLGLTIVASIAHLHGGSLSFTRGRAGTCANLVIQRQ